MLANRSMPRCTVMPVLAYPNVQKAAAWLCDAFGFTLRIDIGTHRAQLNVGDDGAVMLSELTPGDSCDIGHSVMVRIADVDGHCKRAKERGARILKPPADHPYGERQYNVEDLAGHHWTFSQSIADVDPKDWGGTAGKL